MKIVLLSDNHRDLYSIHYIQKKYADLPYRVHCGDNGLLPEQMEGFTAVAGNMDFWDYPPEIVLEIEGHRILVLHGHMLFPSYRADHDLLAAAAKQQGCDAVFYGHTHLYYDGTVNGVRMLNPGSIYRNRDESPRCFMEVEITEDAVTAKRINFNMAMALGEL
ncbi:MAG: YfcE family phosphodiesterase [Solobacterium sp.]|nr:YfcE family phosphodiesterase [Solobacterium sp.]